MDEELDYDVFEFAADAEAAGMRLDHFLTRNMPDLSRARIQNLIEAGLVEVNERGASKTGQKLKGGESVTVNVPPAEPLAVTPENIELNVVYDDDSLAVIDKPAGMVTHPGAGVTSGTLVNALLYRMGDSLSGISGVARPGIVHRLDKETSGLIVIAKDDRAHHSLAEQIKSKTARRNYIALVEGVMKDDRGTVDKPIGRHPTRRKQMAVVASGRKAVSHYEVLKRFTRFTLVKVMLETGRTHQIRVHMASIGYPVAGDLVYNSKQSGNESWRAKHKLLRHALHAFELTFTHPVTDRLLEFESPLPPDLTALIESLH